MNLNKNLLTILSLIILCSGLAYGFESNGIGGGGGIFNPSISHHDSNFWLTTSDMGGVYYSHDGGSSWTMNNYMQIKSMHKAPAPAFTPTRTYWAKGEDIWVSNDKAVSWSKLINIPGVDINSMSSIYEDVYVFADEEVWYSSNAGSSWNKISSKKLLNAIELDDKLVTADDNEIVFLDGDAVISKQIDWVGSKRIKAISGAKNSTHEMLVISVEGIGLLRTFDGGESFELIFDKITNIDDLQMASNDLSTICGFKDNSQKRDVWCSYDYGNHWKRAFNMNNWNANVESTWIQNELYWGYYITNNGFFMSADDSDLMMLSTQGELFKSTDGGDNWEIAYSDPVTSDLNGAFETNGLEVTSMWNYYVHPDDSNFHYIAYTDIGFATSTDGGTTWTNTPDGSSWRNTFYAVAFDTDDSSIMYAAASSKHDIPHWTAVAPPSSNVNKGGVIVSDDKGMTWSTLGSGLPNRPVTDVLLVDESDGKYLFATVYGAGVYRYDFASGAWTKKSNGFGKSSSNMHALKIKQHPLTGDLYAMITAIRSGSNFYEEGGLWKSSDNGESWQDLTVSTQFFWPTNFDFDTEDSDVIYLTAATAPRKPRGGVFKTTDSGANWQTIFSDADMHSTSGNSLTYDHTMEIYVNPNDNSQIFVGTGSHGLFVSNDKGISFEHVDDFPFASVTNIKLNPLNNEEIIVTTLGGGVWFGEI